ncbi:MAG: ABC transporter permease subunit [Desulfobacteraceae bacterium]|nr:MAG: ABC transporter permease subunit [Desulfobacteraceae bacterium]
MVFSLALILLIFCGIILVVLIKGAAALNLSMIISVPKGGYYLGREGGVANAIVGSLYLAFGASLVSIGISLPVAFALQKEFIKSRRFSIFSRLMLDVLWGTPSIVYGAFGFVVMMYFGLRASLLGGIIVLSLLMMPIMIRSMDEVIRMVPLEMKESAYALGTTRLETSLAVILRQALPGILTAVLLAFGRGIGDAASILFTAGYTDFIPRSILDPVASLPLAVFFQIGSPVPEVQERAYASALILLIIVLLVSVISRILGKRFSKHIIK